MQQQTFWSRMKDLLRPTRRDHTPSADGFSLDGVSVVQPSGNPHPGEGRDSAVVPSDAAIPSDTVVPSDTGDTDDRNGGVLSRWRRNEELIEKLQDGYEKVADLMESIQDHQRKQEVTAEGISNSLESVSSSLTSLESNGQAQAQTLGRIADELKAGNERASRWESNLRDMPQLARDQRDAMNTVAQHLDSVVQHEVHLAQSLDTFKDAVSGLSEATTSSSVAVRNLQMSALESQADLGALIRQQNKRFSMLFALTMLLVIAVVTIGCILAWNTIVR